MRRSGQPERLLYDRHEISELRGGISISAGTRPQVAPRQADRWVQLPHLLPGRGRKGPRRGEGRMPVTTYKRTITAIDIIRGLGGNERTGMCLCPTHDD